jgi:hypothetical protein
MALLPEFESKTASAIFAAYQRQPRRRRPHLGASLIGKPCERELWYTFRWCADAQFEGRVLRLFETGQLEESRVVNNLRAIGCTVHEVDENTGRQFWYSDHGGHFSGSMDGVVLGIPEAEATWHLLEIKTHNLKSFSELKRIGVQMGKPQHLAQMRVYMGWAELPRALYFAVCKDTDDIYTERVPEATAEFQFLRAKALRIISAKSPDGVSKAADCTYCDFRSVCEGARLPLVHCRTCQYMQPITEGTGSRWLCDFDGHEVPYLLQERSCENHLFIPALVTFGTLVEAGDGFNVYDHGVDTYFVNSTPPSFPACNGECFLSKDMERAR